MRYVVVRFCIRCCGMVGFGCLWLVGSLVLDGCCGDSDGERVGGLMLLFAGVGLGMGLVFPWLRWF